MGKALLVLTAVSLCIGEGNTKIRRQTTIGIVPATHLSDYVASDYSECLYIAYPQCSFYLFIYLFIYLLIYLWINLFISDVQIWYVTKSCQAKPVKKKSSRVEPSFLAQFSKHRLKCLPHSTSHLDPSN